VQIRWRDLQPLLHYRPHLRRHVQQHALRAISLRVKDRPDLWEHAQFKVRLALVCSCP
jgi:hypothetical protein